MCGVKDTVQKTLKITSKKTSTVGYSLILIHQLSKLTRNNNPNIELKINTARLAVKISRKRKPVVWLIDNL